MSTSPERSSRPRKKQHLDMPDAETFARQYRGSHDNAQLPASRLPYPVYDYAGPSYQHARTYVSRIPVRQATMEDYTRKIHLLPLPPASEHSSDQNLPVIEPGTPQDEPHDYDRQVKHGSAPRSRSTIDDAFDYGVEVPHDTRSRPEITTTVTSNTVPRGTSETAASATVARPYSPIVAALNVEPDAIAYEDSLEHMPEDEYTSALGGLHNISNIQRKESKRERTRRFFQGLKRGLSGRRA